MQVNQLPLLTARRAITGSNVGGLPEVQEVMNFCAEHNIVPEYELISWKRLDEVFELLDKKNDTVKRFVLDLNDMKR